MIEPEEMLEHLEAAEHAPDSARKRVVTMLILAVTLTTSAIGYAANRASSNSDNAARRRQTHTLAGQRAQLDAIARRATVSDVQDDISEYSWTSTVRTYQIIDEKDPTEIARLTADKTELSKDQTGEAKAYPEAEQNYLKFYADGNRDTNRELQLAEIAGQQATAWTVREESYITIIGLFAVALFLLGLSLTVQRRNLATGFVSLAMLLWAVAIAWSVVATSHHVPHTNLAAIEAYVEGRAALDEGQVPAAVDHFAQATKLRPDYADAWSILGQARARTGVDGLRASVADLRKAIRYGRNSATDYNNLATAEGLGAGDTGAALRDIDRALRLDDGEALLYGTKAEVLLARGDEGGARAAFGKAIELVRERGPVFRDFWFASLRADLPAFANTQASSDQRDQWSRLVRETEASLDSLGAPEPRGTTSATVTNVRVVTDKADSHVTFDYTGIQSGQHVSVRLYTDGRLDLELSVRNIAWVDAADGHAARGPFIAPAVTAYDVEIYVDGHLVSDGNVPVTKQG